MSHVSEVAVLRRIIEPDKPLFSPRMARAILQWKFADEDEQRMEMLLEKARQRKLTRAEKADAEAYERVGHLVSILQAKARASLRRRNVAS